MLNYLKKEIEKQKYTNEENLYLSIYFLELQTIVLNK
jgi:hypothetical protein